MKQRLLVLIGIVTLLSGCSAPWAADPTAVPTMPPTAVAQAPTATSAPTTLPEPTLTMAPPGEPTVEPTTPPVPTATPRPPLSAEQRQELFNDVWQTIDEHYLYEDFHGVDWAAIRAAYAPKIAAATNDDDFYHLLEALVAELDDEHSRFAPPVEARTEDALASGTDSYVGIGVLTNVEDAAAFITLVFPDSPAAEAGITRGDRIIAVNGQPFTTTDAIRGPEGSQVQLTVQAPQADPRELALTRRAVVGRITPSSERLPNAPEIGYLLIPSLWADDMHTQVISQLAELQAQDPPLAGLIIDLRGNGGGWRSVLQGLLSQFVEGDVGEFYSQSSAYPLNINSGVEFELFQDLPLVVLVDHNSASYAEVLAAALQYAGATVIGTPSQGNTETIFQYNFDDGSRLWVAQEGFRLPNGTNLEGVGVQPDYRIEEDWTQYSIPNDPAILTAIAVIEQKAGN